MTISINGIDQSVPSVEYYGRAVQDITALKAIGPSERFDKQHVYVEDQTRPYYFDIQSVTAESLPDIVQPDDAPAAGRWIKLPQMMGPPAAHASTHTDGSDQIASVTGAVNGFMTAADKTKLDGIALLADVTGDNPPQVHVHGRGDLPAEIAYEDEANIFLVRQTFNGSIQLFDEDATPVASRRLRVIDGLFRSTDLADLEGRHIARTSLELITNAEVAGGAAIAESKLALNFATSDPALKINRAGDQALTGDWDAGANRILLEAIQARPASGLQLRSQDGSIAVTINDTITSFNQNIGTDVDATRTIGTDGVGFAKIVVNTIRPSSTGSPPLTILRGNGATWLTLTNAGNATFGLNTGMDDNFNFFWGTSFNAEMKWSTVQTNPALLLTISGSNTFILGNSSTPDLVIGVQSTPTMVFHDGGVGAGDWGSITHDGTNLAIVVNAGDLEVTGNIIPEADATRTIGISTAVYGTVWSRILRPDAGNSLLLLDANGATAISVGGSGGEIAINSGAIDRNFRIESVGSTSMFDIDTGLNRIGIAQADPLGTLHVNQLSATGAIPVLVLDQADVSEEMIEFITTIGVGNAIEAIGAKSLTTTHFIKITIPGGLTVYMPAGTIA